ncbi:MAG: hypothetical protein MJZ14_04505, partial [Paludibacteraceae bacterium]|nr:hypothetical protein [Paludibacteraceae bacterium]
MNLLRNFVCGLIFLYVCLWNAHAAVLVSSVMADPASYDNVYEYVEFITSKRIDFSETPYTVVICNNGTILRPHGWLTGSTLTYAIQLDSGVVEAGQTFYVGGPTPKLNGPKSDDIHLSNWYAVNYTEEDGAGGIGLNQQWRVGMVGNGGPSADGIAVFEGRAEDLTEESVPLDCVFYGDAVGDAAAYGYRLPDGSLLTDSSEIFISPGSEKLMKFAGTYNYLTDEWEVARTAVPISLKREEDIYSLIQLVPIILPDTMIVEPIVPDTLVPPLDTIPPIEEDTVPIILPDTVPVVVEPDTIVVPPLDTIPP